MLKENKKIVIVTGSLGSGGLERVTALIANWYASKNWNVYIVLLLNVGDNCFVDLDPNVNIISYPNKAEPNSIKKLFLSIKWISFLKKVFKQIKPSVVLAMTLKICALCCLSCNKTTRIVMREISDPKSKVRNRIVDRILFLITQKRVNSIIFQTNWERSCYPLIMQKKGSVIPNPVLVDVEASNEKKLEIVTMGRLLNNQKRHDVLIESFSIFHKKHPDYILKIYGNGPDGNKDMQLIKKLNIEKSVLLKSATPTVHDEIKDASMFVMTSDYEGLSNALVEAMLIGIPCITSNWPGAEDVIKNEINGLIYKRQDINELVMCMEKMLDKSLALKVSSLGKKEKEKYNIENVLPLYGKEIEG